MRTERSVTMKSSNTSSRLKLLMQERGLKQVDIINACKPFCEKFDVQIRKNDLSQYVSGKTQPNQIRLTILGLALNVNEVWLMGYDVPMQRETKTHSKDAINLTAGEEQLLELFRQIPEAEQPVVLDMIAAALSALNNRLQS